MQGSQHRFKQVGLLDVCPTGKEPLWAGVGGVVSGTQYKAILSRNFSRENCNLFTVYELLATINQNHKCTTNILYSQPPKL